MRIIVDTNRIIASILKDSASRAILESGKADFYTIGLSKKEFARHRLEVAKKAGLTEDEVAYLTEKVYSRLAVMKDEHIQKNMEEAKVIMDDIDSTDTPFIAAAIACDAVVWSDDQHFQKQKKVKVVRTKELLGIIRENLSHK